MEEQDPRSIYYVRIHTTESINKKRLTFFLFFNILGSTFIYLITQKITYVLLFTFLSCIIFIKYILIFFIKIYQKVAPTWLRDKCRFEPSCSNYMLQSLEKYGLFKGICKGLNRLKRCNINDGGYDYP